jgi:large subunit ribosomal protein L10
MAIDKAKKDSLRVVCAERFGKANASIVAEYRGLSAGDLASLRVQLRKAQCEFRVIKNRVAIKAIEHHVDDAKAICDKLVGPVGVTYIYGDVASGAKALLNFAKDKEAFKVTGGLMDGKALSLNQIKDLSDLPSKEVLLARIIGTLVSPHRGLLTVLNGVSSKLVRVIGAIKDKKA